MRSVALAIALDKMDNQPAVRLLQTCAPPPTPPPALASASHVFDGKKQDLPHLPPLSLTTALFVLHLLPVSEGNFLCQELLYSLATINNGTFVIYLHEIFK